MKRNFYSLVLYFFFFFQASNAYSFDFEFVDMPIKDVVSTVSSIANINFVYNGPEKRITWHDTDLSNYDIIDHFEVVLNSNDLMLVAKNNYYLITSIEGDLLTSSFFIYHPIYLKSEDLVKSLNDIWDASGKIKISGGNNFIVCYGLQKYVQDIVSSIIESDTPVHKDFYSIKLQNLPVSDFMKMVEKFLDLIPFCVPDHWTNSLVIRGDSSVHLLFKNLVSLYDVSPTGIVSDVVFLNKLTSDSVIPVLQSTYPLLKVHKLLDDKVVLSGDSQDVTKAKSLLSKMDGLNFQVKVDCIIASLSDQSFHELGVRLGIENDSSFVKVNDSLRTFFDPSLLLSLVSDPLNIDVSLTDTNSKGELISQPQLTVLNGHKAEILVGNNIPVIKSTRKRENDSDLESVEIERMDIGVKLVITPVIQGDFVKLNIYQEVSGYNEEMKGVDISTNKKMIDTTVLVADGQTIILGGVKSSENKTVKNSIPLLSEIPLIGNSLFSYDSDRGVNRNLVISLRPKIIRPTI